MKLRFKLAKGNLCPWGLVLGDVQVLVNNLQLSSCVVFVLKILVLVVHLKVELVSWLVAPNSISD